MYITKPPHDDITLTSYKYVGKVHFHYCWQYCHNLPALTDLKCLKETADQGTSAALIELGHLHTHTYSVAHTHTQTDRIHNYII